MEREDLDTRVDEKGGEVPPEEFLEEAKEFDFLTLPEEVIGTNCLNCSFAKEVGNEKYICGHTSLRGLPINERNCCSLWSAPGVIRHWKEIKALILQKAKERGEHPFHDQMDYQSIEGFDTWYGHREDGDGPTGWMGKDPPAPERWIPGRDKALSWLTSGLGGDLVAPPAFSLNQKERKKKRSKGLPVESGYRARGSKWDWEPIGIPSSAKALPPLTPGHQPTLALDIDGTIAHTIPQRGGPPKLSEVEPNKDAVEAIQRFHDNGWRIIIWTVRDDIKEIEEWLDKHGIPFDYINENPDQPTSSPKILADYYVDDRAIHFSNWRKVAEKIARQQRARQPVSSDAGYESLLELAKRGQPELEKFLKLLQFPMLHLDDFSPEELDKELEKEGPLVLLSPLKKNERATVKVDTDYDGDWSKLLDVVRAAVAVDSWEELEQAVGKLDEIGLPLARKPKNRFKKPLYNGYRDFLVNYRLPSGMICEVQFHLKPILQAREKEKEHYAQVRAIRAAMEEEDRDSMTEEEVLLVEEVLDISRALFEEAWDRCREGAPEWDKKYKKEKSLSYRVKQGEMPPVPGPGMSPMAPPMGQPEEKPKKSPYLHWHKDAPLPPGPEGAPPEAQADPMTGMPPMGGMPTPGKVRKSPYLHWHKYFTPYSIKAEHGEHTVTPISPSDPSGTTPAFTGSFRDRLGRLTCYLNGKKVPCRSKGEGVSLEPNPHTSDVKPTARWSPVEGGRGPRKVQPKSGSEVQVNYAIVFNSRGEILENPDDEEFGGFIWTTPVKEGDEQQAVINQIKQEGVPVHPLDEIGKPEEGEGYWLLHSKDGEKGNWLSIGEVKQRIDSSPREEWQERGNDVLLEAVKAAKGKVGGEHKGEKGKKSLSPSPFGPFSKAVASGPKFTGSFLDTRNRRTCLQGGEHVPCEEFGGEGRGWTDLRQEEDLYDSIRRLIDKVKTGSGDWTELVGLLVHSHPEELQKIKADHKLTATPESKQIITQFLQGQLQQLGHSVGGGGGEQEVQ